MPLMIVIWFINFSLSISYKIVKKIEKFFPESCLCCNREMAHLRQSIVLPIVLTKETHSSTLQNIEPVKMVGKVLAAAKPTSLLDAKEKRRAFGDIENRIG
jgi:hypothetical protein